jgi:hypothetical protein
LEQQIATQTLAARMDNVEQRVARLEQLPARVDALTSQISQLRDAMHDEFSGVRGEMAAEFAAVRDEIQAGDEETRRALRDEIGTGLAEVMAQGRTLHEGQKAALALIAEGRQTRARRQR